MLFVHWGFGQREKGTTADFSARELKIRLEVWGSGDWIWSSRSVDPPLDICYPGRNSPWVEAGSLLRLWTGTKQRVREGKDLWVPQELGTRRQGWLSKVLYCRAVNETGGLDLGEQNKRRSAEMSVECKIRSC